MKKYRIGLVALHPVPYQVPFYRALARHPAIDPTVIYLDDITLRGDYNAEFRGLFKNDVSILDGYKSCFTTNLSPWTTAPVVGRVNPGVVSAIVKARFDAVLITGYHHVSAILAIAAAKSVGTKVLLRAETDLTNPSRSVLASVKQRLLPALLRQTDAVMYSSQRNKQYFLHYGVPAERLFPLLSSVDNAALASMRPQLSANRAALRASFGIPEDAVVFLFAGRFTERKRVLDPLLAARDVLRARNDVWLLYVGDGPLRETLEARAELEGVAHRVVFAGFQEPADVPQFLAASDVFVLPSGYDPTPKALNEAMNFELPAIISDKVGTAFDLVQDGRNGLVYPMGDISTLGRQIRLLAENKTLRQELGQNALLTVSEWSPQANAEGVLAAIRSCVR